MVKTFKMTQIPHKPDVLGQLASKHAPLHRLHSKSCFVLERLAGVRAPSVLLRTFRTRRQTSECLNETLMSQ